MNTESERPAGRRSRYPKEFRRDATALVIDQHHTVVDVAKELGVVEPRLTISLPGRFTPNLLAVLRRSYRGEAPGRECAHLIWAKREHLF